MPSLASLTTFSLSLLLLLPSVAATTPPACLLAAINAQTTPSDLTSLCGNLSLEVAGNITEKCTGDLYKQAVDAYQTTCSEEANIEIILPSPSSSSATSSETGTASSSGATVTASGTGAKATGSANVTRGSGSIASATSASGSVASATTARNGAGALGASMLLGMMGVGVAVLF